MAVKSTSVRRTREATLAALRQSRPIVLPSLLQCDFGRLADEIARLEDAGAAALHLDVMDGRFVPNFTYGLTIVDAVRRFTQLPLDVHLMMVEPEQYLARFYEAGADSLTVHVEAVADARATMLAIRDLGAVAGLAINPPTPLASLEPALDVCDLALVMSVMPGFGGQSFNPVALEKLRALRDSQGDRLLLEVDGGVSDGTISACSQAGAELFVVGSGIFAHNDYGERLNALTAGAGVAPLSRS